MTLLKAHRASVAAITAAQAADAAMPTSSR